MSKLTQHKYESGKEFEHENVTDIFKIDSQSEFKTFKDALCD